MKKNGIGVDAEKPGKPCSDMCCPWHGKLTVRGRIFKGKVSSAKAPLSAVVEWDYYNYIKKYDRYERKKTKVRVHNPPCIGAKQDNVVRIMECRPLSKTKRFVIIEKVNQ